MRTNVRWLGALLLGACGPLPLAPVGDAGGSTTGQPPMDAGDVANDLSPSRPAPDGGAPADPTPSVRITSPTAGSVVADPWVRIEGTAADDTGVAAVLVRIGPNQPIPASSRDGFRTFWVEGSAPIGMFEVEAIARDLEGNASDPDSVQLMRPSMASDADPPTLSVVSPADGSSPLNPLVLVQGTASDDRGVVRIEVERNGELLTERPVETTNLFQTWSRMVPLLAGEENTLVFTAVDASGQRTSATLTLTGRATNDRTVPELELDQPTEGASVDAPTLSVQGSASDDAGIREVKVRVGRTPEGEDSVVFGEYQAAETEDGYATFTANVAIPSGDFVVEVLAIDLNGLSTRISRSVTNTFVSEWSDEVALPLRLRDPAETFPLSFSLDVEGINEVFNESLQRDIRVLELDTTALITSAVEQIKTSCGTRWQEDNENPRHDCSSTGYGSDRTPPIPWQQTPEYSMVRLLTMTPANVAVAGTSLQGLEEIANLLNLGGGFQQILAETLGIPKTQEIVPTENVVYGLQSYWLQSHPEVLPGARLPISLYDAVNDLAPLAELFGPAGDHPGLLDPAFPPYAKILGDDFEMQLVAESNLRWLDGVDIDNASGRPQKDYLALVFDTTGPTFDDVLEFDFNDPARFDVQGLVNEPRADMRMLLRENPDFVRSCTDNDATCLNNLPTAPADGYVWANPPHEIETVVAAGAFDTYKNRSDYEATYRLIGIGAATVTVGKAPDPAGWTTFETLLSLGSPPPPQYIWETISEVAQVALHNYGDTELPEGEVNVAFSLEDVDVGLDADGIREAMRSPLQEQRQELSERLLGDYRSNNGSIDFYYRRGADDAPYLFFVSAGDPLPTDDYTYANPGFFADAALATKLSSLDEGTSGDSTHEKLALTAGETTVYMADMAGEVYRLRLLVEADPTEIQVLVSKKVR